MKRNAAIILFLFIAAGIGVAYEMPLLEARMAMCKRLFDKGEYRDALHEYEVLLLESSGARDYEIHFWRGNCYFQLNEYEKSLTEYRRAANNRYATQAIKMKAYYNMIISYLYLGKPEACEERATFFIHYYPDSTYADNAYFYQAEAYLAAQRLDEAKTRLERFVRRYPRSERRNDAKARLMLLDLLEAAQGEERQDGRIHGELAEREAELERKLKQLTKMKELLDKKAILLDEKEAALREAEGILRDGATNSQDGRE